MQPSSPEAPIKFSKEFLPQMRRVARNREPMHLDMLPLK